MIRIVKLWSLAAICIAAYSFAGAMTCRYYEALYPLNPSTYDAVNMGQVYSGAFWPVGVPILIGIHAASLVTSYCSPALRAN